MLRVHRRRSRGRVRRVVAARIVAGSIALVVTATLVTSFTASTNVPASRVGVVANPRLVSQLAPVGCGSLSLTALVQGSGTFTNSQSHSLVLGSAGADTITDSGTGDCVVGGGGTSSIIGSSTDICVSGPTLNVANPCPTFGAATQIVLSGATSTLASETTRAFTATVEDAAGNTVTSGTDATDTITFTQPSGTGTVSGLRAVAATAGVATITVTGAVAGTVTLQGAGTLNGTARTSNTSAFSVTFGAATQIVLSGSTDPLASGVARVFTTTIEDAAGNTVTSGADATDTISFSIPGSTGTVSGVPTASATAGVATTTVTGVQAGAIIGQASATLNGAARTSNTIAFTVTFGAATQVVLAGSTATLGSGATRVLTATIEDAAGNTVTSGADASDTISFSQSAGTGSVSGLRALAASGGVATITVTGAQAGTVSLVGAGTLNGTARTSNTISFTVTVPTITTPTVSNPVKVTHDGTATFSVTGTSFENGLTVAGNGSATVNSFTWVSATSVTVNVTGHGNAGALGSFTITNPDGGTVTSANGSFINS